MKIVYLSDARLPTKAAHGVHIMKMCEAFAKNHELELLVFGYNEEGKETPEKDIYNFYDVSPDFKISRLLIKKFKGSKYYYSLLQAIRASKLAADIYYSRDFFTAVFLVNIGRQVVHEFHHPLKMKEGLMGWFVKRYLRKVQKITVISQALKKHFLSNYSLKPEQIIVAHDASNKPNTKEKIYLDSNKFHVGYVGHLYEGKGMEVVTALAAELKEVQFHVVGGNADDINKWQAKHSYPNLQYHGFVKQSNLSQYINAFDVCLLPNQKVVRIWNDASTNISDFTSPLKMFEYMAHKKAIIASDLEVLKEVLNVDNAILCSPVDINAWKEAIQRLRKEPQIRVNLGQQAYNDFINSYTWDKRAEYLLEKIHEK